MKSSHPSPQTAAFYVIRDTVDDPPTDRVEATAGTASPWGPDSQHGGPPSALLVRALERLAPADRVIGRVSVDLLGPVPVGPLTVSATMLRPGRSVDLCEAVLHDEAAGRSVARARAWRFPDAPGPRGTGDAGRDDGSGALPHGPDDGAPHPRPEHWCGGYLDHVDWRWIKGSVTEPGPGVVWMRPRVPLLATEVTSPLQRLMACVDSASGVSTELDLAEWGFLNTELTVHVLRPPRGEWVCLDAETLLGPGSVGMATAAVYDEDGLVARSAQSLLVARR
jgi:acyl-coenzyme A thioesterase PaaI-like protein